MATPTCTSFLYSTSCSHFREEFLVTGNGPFLELFRLHDFLRRIYNPNQQQPLRTRVFENFDVLGMCPAFHQGHSLVIGCDGRSIQGMFVSDERILAGGYADLTSDFPLIENGASSAIFQRIPDTKEILVLSEHKLLHFRFEFEEDSMDFSLDIVDEFDINSLIPSTFDHSLIVPIDIRVETGHPLPITLLVSLHHKMKELKATMVLLKRLGGNWTSRSMVCDNATVGAIIDDGADGLGVMYGTDKTTFFSTGRKHPGVSKQQICIKKFPCMPSLGRCVRFHQFTTNNGTRMLMELTCRVLNLYTVSADNIVHTRSFVHNNGDNSGKDRALRLNEIASLRLHPCIVRRSLCIQFPQVLSEDPVAARYISTVVDSVPTELIAIVYETGEIKLIRLEDIVKNPETTIIPIEIKNKTAKIKCLNQCWSYPPPENSNLHLYSCLYNGFPAVILKNGDKVTLKILNNKQTFDYCCTGLVTQKDGGTVTRVVYYNKLAISTHLLAVGSDIDMVERTQHGMKENAQSSATILRIFDTGSSLVLISEEQMAVSTPLPRGNMDVIVHLRKNRSPITAVLTQLKGKELLIIVGFQSGEVRYAISRITVTGEKLAYDLELGLSTNLLTSNFGEIAGILSSIEDQFVVVTTDLKLIHLDEKLTMCPTVRDYFDTPVNSTDHKIAGFITIQSSESLNQRLRLLLVKSNRILYFRDVTCESDVHREPIPLHTFDGSTPIFGHFDGPAVNGRILIQTMAKSKDGESLKLHSLSCRLETLGKRESIAFPKPLNQPDRIIRILPHSDPSLNFVICTLGCMIEVHELNAMGTVKPIKQIVVADRGNMYLSITGFDARIVTPERMMYILTGSLNGVLVLTHLNLDTFTECTYVLVREMSDIFQVSFFGKICLDKKPEVCAVVSKEHHRLIRIGYGQTPSKILQQEFIRNAEKAEIRVHEMTLIATGDEETGRYDAWYSLMKSGLQLQLRRVRGEEITATETMLPPAYGQTLLRSACAVTAKVSNDLWADFIFLAKESGHLFVCGRGSWHDKCELDVDIPMCHISEMRKASKFMALNAELVSVESRRNQTIVAKVRLYIAKRRSISIQLFRLEVNSEGLDVMARKEGSVSTSIGDPSYVEVARMTSRNGSAIRYAFVSGSEGTQIVRICNKKLVDPITVSWEKAPPKEE